MTKIRMILGATLTAALIYGCGSGGSGIFGGTTNTSTSTNGSNTVSGRTATITELAPLAVAGDAVDSIEVEGFDANGHRVFGPTVVPFSSSMTIPEPGPEVATLEIDYLRNQNFALYRATVPRIGGAFDLSDPAETPTSQNTTGFSVVPDGDGFKINVTTSGDATGDVRTKGVSPKVDTTPITFRGVCYSPAPIKANNKDAPALGDFFWDSTANSKNWQALWGTGPLDYDRNVNGRGDVDNIRAMGCNFIRTYCMISRQLFVLEGNNFVPGKFPQPPDKYDHFTHKAFLDACWNNGDHPIYVMVGIPLPDTILYKYLAKAPGEQAYWDYVLEETVNDVKDHPAVMGFTLFNEIDENRSAWPGVNEVALTGGTPDENSDYYYGKLKQYSKKIHDLTGRDPAHRKLVGWAAHENRPHVYFGSNLPAGNPYFAQLDDIDYYGINVYQKIDFNGSLSRSETGSLGKLTGSIRKPIFMTEVGWAASGHDKNDKIYEDAETRSNTAETITRMIPQLTVDPVVAGFGYFEYSDEWWKQPPHVTTEWNGILPLPNGQPNRDGAMPNGFHDQEAFGLFSTALGAGRRSTSDEPYQNNRPVTPVDPYIERTELTQAFRAAIQTNPR